MKERKPTGWLFVSAKHHLIRQRKAKDKKKDRLNKV